MTSKELKKYMIDGCFSEQELADVLGLTKGAILHWLNDRRDIPPPVIKILRYFEETHTDLRELNE